MHEEKILASVARQTTQLEGAFQGQIGELIGLTEKLVTAFNQGRKLLLVGHGVLAPIAGLVASLFLHKLSLDRPPLPALALGLDQPLLHSLARGGIGHEIYLRQLRVVADAGDLLLIFSDGQHDPAIDSVLEEARRLDLYCAAVMPLRAEGAIVSVHSAFVLQTELGAEIALGAQAFGQLLCELVENELFGI